MIEKPNELKSLKEMMAEERREYGMNKATEENADSNGVYEVPPKLTEILPNRAARRKYYSIKRKEKKYGKR